MPIHEGPGKGLLVMPRVESDLAWRRCRVDVQPHERSWRRDELPAKKKARCFLPDKIAMAESVHEYAAQFGSALVVDRISGCGDPPVDIEHLAALPLPFACCLTT